MVSLFLPVGQHSLSFQFELKEMQRQEEEAAKRRGHLGSPSRSQLHKGFETEPDVIITPTQLQWLKTYSRRGISIDDTHNAMKYPMKLATVVVADDLDRGLPAAFLLSDTMTAADVQKLFMEIKELLPEFNPKYIVTDEVPCFFNGYKAVFPLSSTQLRYCRWHVSKTWERKVRELVAQYVKSKLDQLLRVSDLEEFQKRFAEVIAYLEVEHQNAMALYLKNNYLGKNANSRADCLVELLIRPVEDLADSNEIKDRRQLASVSFKSQQTTIRHRDALMTGFSGLFVNEHPHRTLSVVCCRIVKALEQIPPTVAYRKYTEAAEYELDAEQVIIQSNAWESLVEQVPNRQWDWPSPRLLFMDMTAVL
ncbi:unnamed protein product [Heligmosomoides polygyrus]|uniref:MULE domain-containing protein n=1 Tax=Heligmosomoides polygyrus TaxID=6339 RepID=A0A183FIN6_HELPZ|nr:unnamed protein product [Heligmosomoides polygyrus]